MAKIVAVVNQKGGVGKTTTCVNLAYSLGQDGVRTLLCDFDPQGNATSGYGASKRDTITIYDVLINGADVRESVLHTPYGDLIPSGTALAGAGVELVGLEDREFLLKRALAPLEGDYDVILIDCPPSLELLTVNALCAADSVLIPIQCEYYALEGLSDLLNTVGILQKRLNPALTIEGMLMTMYDRRTQLSGQVADEVRKHFPALLFPVYIPRNVRAAEAPSHGKPVLALDRWARSGRAYRKLARLLAGPLKTFAAEKAARLAREAEKAAQAAAAETEERTTEPGEAETSPATENTEPGGTKTSPATENAELGETETPGATEDTEDADSDTPPETTENDRDETTPDDPPAAAEQKEES